MRITNHKDNGVFLQFDNGICLSTIWGWGSYSENHDWHPKGDTSLDNVFKKIEEGSHNVEIMFTDGDPKFIKKMCIKYDGENPIGYLDLNDWLDIVQACKKYKKVDFLSQKVA